MQNVKLAVNTQPLSIGHLNFHKQFKVFDSGNSNLSFTKVYMYPHIFKKNTMQNQVYHQMSY